MEKGELKVKANSLGASGFTLAILSILSLGIFGVITAIVGFVFCFFQQKYKPTKLGKVGLILSVIGLALSLIWIFYLAPILANYLNTYSAA